MTDNEIIQALESEVYIAEYVDNDFADNVSIALLKDTLDLINRQKAEIERLNKANSLCVTISFDKNELQEIADKCVKNIEIDINLAKSDAIKDFSKAMIEKINGGKISSADIADFTVNYLRGENNGKL